MVPISLQAAASIAPAGWASAINVIAFWHWGARVSLPRTPKRWFPTFFAALTKLRLLPPLLLAPQLLLQTFSLSLILGAELLQLLLLLQGQNRTLIGILRSRPPTVHLLRVQTPLPAVGIQLCGIEPSGLQHHRESVSSAIAVWLSLGCSHHLPCSRQVFLHL